VLSHIRRLSEATKKELAAATTLPLQTTADVIASLEADNLIYRRGKRLGGVGQPSVLYAINPDGVFGLGLSVGRDRQELALVDFNGTIRKRSVVTGDFPNVERLVEQVREGVAQFDVPGTPASRYSGIGISLPHDIWYRPERQGLPEDVLAEWDTHDLAQEIAAATGLPIFVENDTRVAAVAEFLLGGAQGFENFLQVSIGAHISGALVLGGNLEKGAHGTTATLGAIPVGPSRLARATSADDTEALGEFLGDRASLARLMQHLHMHGFTIHTVSELPDAIDNARNIVQDWLEDCVDALVEGLTACFAVIDVEAVVIQSLLPSYMVMEIVTKLGKRLKRSRRFGLVIPEIRLSGLGADGPLIGSAVLPIYEHFSPGGTYQNDINGEEPVPAGTRRSARAVRGGEPVR
jgi:predicted NBD/HSP70 family sugar kinase